MGSKSSKPLPPPRQGPFAPTQSQNTNRFPSQTGVNPNNNSVPNNSNNNNNNTNNNNVNTPSQPPINNNTNNNNNNNVVNNNNNNNLNTNQNNSNIISNNNINNNQLTIPNNNNTNNLNINPVQNIQPCNAIIPQMQLSPNNSVVYNSPYAPKIISGCASNLQPILQQSIIKYPYTNPPLLPHNLNRPLNFHPLMNYPTPNVGPITPSEFGEYLKHGLVQQIPCQTQAQTQIQMQPQVVQQVQQQQQVQLVTQPSNTTLKPCPTLNPIAQPACSMVSNACTNRSCSPPPASVVVANNPTNLVQTLNCPLEKDIIFNPPPTNLGLNAYPPVKPVPGLPPPLLPHNLNAEIPVRNMVDLPSDQNRKKKKCKLFGGGDKKKDPKSEIVSPNRVALQKLYDISPYEMSKLKKLFDLHSGMDRKLNFQEFIRLYGNMNPNLRGPFIISLAERAFQSSDTNDDGLLSFDEFIVAYCLTKPYKNFLQYPDNYQSLNPATKPVTAPLPNTSACNQIYPTHDQVLVPINHVVNNPATHSACYPRQSACYPRPSTRICRERYYPVI